MAAPRYMLDTSVASYIIRGPSPALVARLVAVPMVQLCISAITQGSLLYGLARKPAAADLQLAVREFLMRVDVLPWDSAAATRYGVLRASLEFGGAPLGNLDTLIAAHALAIDAVLVTRDRAFARVPTLAVEDWLSP
jgi:tRNA(fMet)-specific endonuclease VapC